jgi:hypothetical protein
VAKAMNMLIKTDSEADSKRANELIVKSLLEKECQFTIDYINKTRLRIAFHEGMWKIMRDNGDYFVFYDSFGLEESNNLLLEGLVRAKTELSEKRNWVDQWREKPATVIVESISLWTGSLAFVESIKLTQWGRDGWFTNFND